MLFSKSANRTSQVNDISMQNFLMPKIGLTMTEGAIAEWSVQPGLQFEAGQIVVVIETDKVTNEIEAPQAGMLTRILVEAGETVDVGVAIAEWLPAGSAAVVASAAVPAAAVATAMLAATAGVPLRRAAGPAELSAARRLTEAKQTIPHFYLVSELEVSALSRQRAAWNQDHPADRISVTHLLVAAIARALTSDPKLNTTWDDGNFVQWPTVDIGIAVDTPQGLVVPVLRDAGAKSLVVIAHTVTDLASRARAGRLVADDVGGATISLSNAGMYDVTLMASIIPTGHAAILGVGSERALFRPGASGEPELRREINLVLSCDHRVLDGVTGLRLLNAVRALLAAPATLFD